MAVSSRRTRNTDPRVDAAARAVVRKYKSGWRSGTLSADQQAAIDAARSVKGWRSTPEEKNLVLKAMGMGGDSSSSGSSSSSSRSSSSGGSQDEQRQLAAMRARTTSGNKLYMRDGKFVSDYEGRPDFSQGYLPTSRSADRLQSLVASGWTTKAPKGGNFDTRLVNIGVEVPREIKGVSPSQNWLKIIGSYRTDKQPDQIALYRARPDRDGGSSGGGGGGGGGSAYSGRSSASGTGGGSKKSGVPKVENYLTPNGKKKGGRWTENSPFTQPSYDQGYNGAGSPGTFSGRPEFAAPTQSGSGGGGGLGWLDDVGRTPTSSGVEPIVPAFPAPDVDRNQQNSFDRVLNFLGDYDTLIRRA